MSRHRIEAIPNKRVLGYWVAGVGLTIDVTQAEATALADVGAVIDAYMEKLEIAIRSTALNRFPRSRWCR